MAPTPRFRFSLRTLLLVVLLIGAGATTWFRWEPWTMQATITANEMFDLAGFLPDGKTIFVTYPRGIVALYSQSGVSEKVINVSKTTDGTEGEMSRRSIIPLEAIQFTPDGTCFVVTDEGRSSLWNLITGEEVAVLSSAGTESTAISNDGKYAAAYAFTDGRDNKVSIFDCTTGNRLASFEVFPLRELWFSADSQYLNGVDRSADLWRWNWRSPETDTHVTKMIACNFGGRHTPDGRWYVSTHTAWNSPSTDVRIFDAENLTLAVTFQVARSSVKWTNAGSQFSFTDENGEVILVDAATNSVTRRPDLSPEDHVAFHPSGQELATAIVAETHIWDLRNKTKCVLPAAGERARDLCYSSDGNSLLIRTNQLRLYQRRRPNYAWGVYAMPELWLSALLVIALLFSIYRDYRPRAIQLKT